MATMIVMMVFTRIPGVSYSVPGGQVSVDVPRGAYVDKGFIATQDETGAWSFAPAPVSEEPPEDPYEGLSVAERVALLRVEKAAADMEFAAKLESLEQAII